MVERVKMRLFESWVNRESHVSEADSQRFQYEAQSPDGAGWDGQVSALNADAAREVLEGRGLRVLSLKPCEPAKPGRLGREDFLTFNEQLIIMTRNGVPLDEGLRLLAMEMRTPRMAAAVREVADDLEAGSSLPEALAKHSDRFPPLYDRLVEAGIRSNDLGGVLFGLMRHTQLVQKLRDAVLAAAVYPAVVLVMFGILVFFIGQQVIPAFELMYDEFHAELPTPTKIAFAVGHAMPYIVGGVTIGALSLFLPWLALRLGGRGAWWLETIALRLPLIGVVLKRGRLARWANAVQVGLSGGLALPEALKLAAGSISSRAISRDTELMIASHEQGMALSTSGSFAVVPEHAVAAMDAAMRHGNLLEVIGTLGQIYMAQAEARLRVLRSVFQPILIVAMAILIGAFIVAMFLPLVEFMGVLG
jgi:type IV pilus assembly protein PilC